MLSFLAPLFLAGAAAAAVPLVLHLFLRQPEVRLRFAAVKLLRGSPVEHTARRRLREYLLLALRVAALLLLSVAFARPFFRDSRAGGPAGLTVLMLDTSASMSAPGREERARQLAREAIARTPASHLVAVVTFADAAQVAAIPSVDRALAVSAVDGARAGFGATRYGPALATAAELVGSSGGDDNSVVVVTDLQEIGWDRGDHAVLPERTRVEVVDVGSLPPNLALTEVRPAADGRIVATIRNAGPAGRRVRTTLALDGRSAGDLVAEVGPNEAAEVTFVGARGTAASVSVEDPDGIQADNVRHVVLNSAARPSVLLVTAQGDLERDAFYAREALTAVGSAGSSFEAEGVAAAQLSTWNSPRLDAHSAVVVMSTRGLERRGRELLAEYVRRGGGVLIAAGPDFDGEVANETLGGRVSITLPSGVAADPRARQRNLVPADARHPVFRAFAGRGGFGLVKFDRVATISDTECQTLARFTTGEPALVECAIGAGRALVFASDLDNAWNDFPLHATFVPFLHEAVRHLTGRRVRVGDYLVGELPAGVPAEPGFVTLPDPSGSAGRRVAVNVDPRESAPERLNADQFLATVTRLDTPVALQGTLSRQQEDRQRIWRYLLVLAMAALAAESFVSRRAA
jgi:hypothetical protein